MKYFKALGHHTGLLFQYLPCFVYDNANKPLKSIECSLFPVYSPSIHHFCQAITICLIQPVKSCELGLACTWHHFLSVRLSVTLPKFRLDKKSLGQKSNFIKMIKVAPGALCTLWWRKLANRFNIFFRSGPWAKQALKWCGNVPLIVS